MRIRSVIGLALPIILLAVSYTLMERSGRGPSSSEPYIRMERREVQPASPATVLEQPVARGRALPPTNHLVNDPSGEDVDVVQSETTIAVRGDTIVVGWNDGYAFVNEMHTGSGFGYSVDRGETWIDGDWMPWGTQARPFGDPSVSVNNAGEWIFTSLDLGDGPLGVTINRGRFVGSTLTWDPAEKYLDGGYIDKEYLDYDPALDRFYMSYVNSNNQGRLTYSDDGGVTWSSPLTVAEGTHVNGFYPLAGIDGEVYVSWIAPFGQPNASVFVRYSSDGGRVWDGPAVEVDRLGPETGERPQCFNRGLNPNNPAMAIDRSEGPYRGRIYYTWTNGAPDDFDAYVSYSDDKGVTWSFPRRINDNENTSEQFWPQVSVGPAGRVSAAWLDRRHATDDNGLCDCYVSQSIDGGSTWGPNRRVSDVSVTWCGVPANAAPNFGDYNELVSDDRSLFITWSDARGGGPDVYFARYDDRHRLVVTGELAEPRTVVSGEGVSWFIPNEAAFDIDPSPPLESPAPLAIPSLALGMLAGPAEVDGVFELSGETLTGNVNLTAVEGTVEGSFHLERTGPSGISLSFDATGSAGLGDIDPNDPWTTEMILWDAGTGVVGMSGQVTMQAVGGALVFALAGTIQLDGNPEGSLPEAQRLTQETTLDLAEALTLHSRAQVESGWLPESVRPRPAAESTGPIATIRAMPNPLRAGTHIRYRLSQPVDGAIDIYSPDGRRVRRLYEGRLEAGAHAIAFDGRDGDGRRLPAGGYLIKLTSGRVLAGGKLIVL